MKHHFFERIFSTILLQLFVIYHYFIDGNITPDQNLFIWLLLAISAIYIIISIILIGEDINHNEHLKRWNRQERKTWK